MNKWLFSMATKMQKATAFICFSRKLVFLCFLSSLRMKNKTENGLKLVNILAVMR